MKNKEVVGNFLHGDFEESWKSKQLGNVSLIILRKQRGKMETLIKEYEQDANQVIHDIIEETAKRECKVIYGMTESVADYLEWVYRFYDQNILEIAIERAVLRAERGTIKLRHCLD